MIILKTRSGGKIILQNRPKDFKKLHKFFLKGFRSGDRVIDTETGDTFTILGIASCSCIKCPENNLTIWGLLNEEKSASYYCSRLTPGLLRKIKW